jgi:hypothetical protein
MNAISHKWIGLIALIFFVKALLLGFWLVPAWEIPDETGHFAYARDIMEGRGIPVLTKAVIGADIMSDIRGWQVNETPKNQIAQHPPLYYVGAGVFWKFATYLTDDPSWLFKAPRALSAAAGALILIALYALMLLVTGDRLASLGIAACIGCIPMLSYLSAGTSHDTTVMLMAVLAVYFWARYLLKKNIGDAYYMAIFLSLAAGTKMTALLLTPPMLAFVMIEMGGPVALRVRHMVTITMIALSLPALWTIRMYLWLGSALPVAGKSGHSPQKISASILDFLGSTYALESIYIHFWGMFGFVATFRDIHLLRIDGWPLVYYSWVSVLVILLLAAVLIRRLWFTKKDPHMAAGPGGGASLLQGWYRLIDHPMISAIFSWMLLCAAALIGIYFYTHVYSSPDGWTRSLFFALSAFVLSAAAVAFLRPLDLEERLVCYSLLVIAFFVAVFLWRLYGIYLVSGSPRALWGRYFFPLIPLMLVAAFLPQFRWMKWPSWVPILFASGFALAEMATLLGQVMPFWKNL